MMWRALCGLGYTVISAPALAADLSWQDITPRLEGCWEGTGLGGDVSECWIVAEDGRADGLFLMRRNGSPNFAEILTIDRFDDTVEMRLKHVNPDMTGWEEKDDFVSFRFIRAEPDALVFRGLTLHFDEPDQLRAELQMTFGESEATTVPFEFTRTATLHRAAKN